MCVHALVQQPQRHRHVCHVSPCLGLGTLWAPQQPQEVAGARASLVLWGRDVRGLCALRLSTAPGSVTLMGQGWRGPGWVPGQPHCSHVAPEGELGQGLGRAARAPHLPRSPLVRRPVVTFAMEGALEEQSPPRSLRLAIAIFVIEIPFTR